MVFFQAELLLGYAYVHWLHEKLTPHKQVIVHVSLLLLSLLMLPVAADPAWKGDALTDPSWAVFIVLTIAVGAPYLMLSTTGPLMQAWYALAFTRPGLEIKPYRLYALSNLASMLALLSYPVVIEPFFAVQFQANMWSIGYAVFALGALLTGLIVWRSHSSPEVTKHADTTPAVRPSLGECLIWIGLAATASILLLTLTQQLTNDVAPVPFLWVLPLSIYLLSFILCFDAPRYYVRKAFLIALPIALLTVDFVLTHGQSVPVMVALLSISLFIFCMVCHGELVRRKPSVRYLTLFYLMLSVGGALGGTFVGLVAPAIFNAYFELPIGLFLCAALTTLVIWKESPKALRVGIAIALVLYSARLIHLSLEYITGYRVVMRNFYSQLRVEDVPTAHGIKRIMRHGNIIHGEQYLDENLRRKPTAYYCPESGIGLALNSLTDAQSQKIGIVGLGVGTLATYGRQGSEMRMYEINDQVVDVARSEFSYLGDSQAKIVSVLGDGRLVLEREPVQNFDLLAMDAFSGDSIPTHLLTLEAMKIYLRHMKPDGILAVHITNQYLDLQPVMAAIAQHYGKVAVLYNLARNPVEPFCRHTIWVLLMSPERAANLPKELQSGIRLSPRPGFKPWTDGFSNLVDILK